jgi:2-polyprenyl-6-hydroxyphenyl methylase/3-demethylubiquinone-9 3-methyltransferase
LLRLLPIGTHDWKQFVTPAELGAYCRAANLRLADTAGMVFSPLARSFRISANTAINYIAMATA